MNIHSTVSEPPLFRVSGRVRGRIDLSSSTQATAHIFILESDIVRVMVLPDGAPHQPATWAIAPGLDDVPVEGRDRFDVSNFTCPEFTLVEQPEWIAVETRAHPSACRVARAGLSVGNPRGRGMDGRGRRSPDAGL